MGKNARQGLPWNSVLLGSGSQTFTYTRHTGVWVQGPREHVLFVCHH